MTQIAHGKKRKAIILTMLLMLAMLVSACGVKTVGSSEPAGSGSGKVEPVTETSADQASDLKGKKIALVMEFNSGTFSQQYLAGVKEEVERFGGELTTFVAETDKSKMASQLEMAVNQKFDGILTDHGDAATLTAGMNKAKEANIPVVAFDALVEIPGITVIEQGDQKMAEMTLEQLAKDAGGKGNIVKIWTAGFAPMERRQVAYEQFLNTYPDIKEIAAFGSVSNSTALDTQAKMEAILKQYPKEGEITAVWASYDEFAKGAARAIQQAGRTDIKIYGIDMSDEDLQMLQNPASPWVASAAVDPKDIGRIQVRYLFQKLHGDQTEDKVILEPVYVHRDQLPADKQISTDELGEYVKGWGGSTQGEQDWMSEYSK
ncbi:sugar ABC transporter substrate-binding protein [Paenibacillus aquistagni]|uniref:Monosaccharide ABC transporter substrate-binding protein, CUT2 family n=1 Tax=Paenibacillus aquistagni TaxID=1852522 RepID=A0A1X7JGW1_9BACL|nr:sugar ABC transporter substrate-binding protein [Paenibacillus aquistagni]SMG26964.1 monosaccharide ABC transporter substrate-binding protein, CUT2 family [Paenibacillus aquistagni]